jgi:peptide chain release factor 3
MTWPIGMGKRFRGVYHLYDDAISFFDPQAEKGTSEIIQGLDNPRLDELIGTLRPMNCAWTSNWCAAPRTPLCRSLSGRQAVAGVLRFGGQQLRRARVCSTPWSNSRRRRARPAVTRSVAPSEPKFSGFVFKIQANMDPKHRDRIAFLRVCSGRFERGMKFKQVDRQAVSVNNAITFMAQDRNTTDEAYPATSSAFPITAPSVWVKPSPKAKICALPASPLCPGTFPYCAYQNPLKIKQLQKGLQQLAEEGRDAAVPPAFRQRSDSGRGRHAAVRRGRQPAGNEYGVQVIFDHYNCATGRFPTATVPMWRSTVRMTRSTSHRTMFTSTWSGRNTRTCASSKRVRSSR